MKKILLALLLVLCASLAQAADKELYLYIWSEYIPDAVVEQFTNETGIKVNISTYDSNEAMYAKLKLVGEGYDLVVPSTYFVSRMRREGMLMPLDKELLPGLANLSARFRDMPADPGGKYSVPYMWGSTAIAVNTAKVHEDQVTKLADLWDPALAGRILLPNDPREVIGLTLKSLGYSFNDVDPGHLEEAYERLKTLMPGVRVFDSDSPKQALLSGEVDVAVMWNGEAFIANAENPDIAYIYPKEGFSLWLDSMCIPAGAKNVAEAHAFLEFLLRPDVAATISTEMGYSTPNAKAMALLPPDVYRNKIVYPADVDLARGEFLDDLGDSVQLFEEYWVKLK